MGCGAGRICRDRLQSVFIRERDRRVTIKEGQTGLGGRQNALVQEFGQSDGAAETPVTGKTRRKRHNNIGQQNGCNEQKSGANDSLRSFAPLRV